MVGGFDLDLSLFLKDRKASCRSNEKFFSLSAADYKEAFKLAARDLKLEKWNLMSYQARHGGATRDILLRRRDLEEVRKRGQWQSYSSVRRYEKSGRLQRVVQTTSPEALRCCQRVAAGLLGLLRGPCGLVPAPP